MKLCFLFFRFVTFDQIFKKGLTEMLKKKEISFKGRLDKRLRKRIS